MTRQDTDHYSSGDAPFCGEPVRMDSEISAQLEGVVFPDGYNTAALALHGIFVTAFNYSDGTPAHRVVALFRSQAAAGEAQLPNDRYLAPSFLLINSGETIAPTAVNTDCGAGNPEPLSKEVSSAIGAALVQSMQTARVLAATNTRGNALPQTDVA